MPTFCAISRAVNLASPSVILFILETIPLREADFGLPDFGAVDGLYTRLRFLFPPPNNEVLSELGCNPVYHLSCRRFYQPFSLQWSMIVCIQMANFMSYT